MSAKFQVPSLVLNSFSNKHQKQFRKLDPGDICVLECLIHGQPKFLAAVVIRSRQGVYYTGDIQEVFLDEPQVNGWVGLLGLYQEGVDISPRICFCKKHIKTTPEIEVKKHASEILRGVISILNVDLSMFGEDWIAAAEAELESRNE